MFDFAEKRTGSKKSFFLFLYRMVSFSLLDRFLICLGLESDKRKHRFTEMTALNFD